MRALNAHEIDNITDSLKALVGCRLQEVVVGATGVGLGFWTRGQGLVWLWFENHSWSPLLLPLTNVPEASRKPLQPLALFLRAHFVDQPLQQVQRDQDLGRAVCLDFGKDLLKIEIHLWPHGGNFIAFAEKRRVAWKKIDIKTEPPPSDLLRSQEAPSRSLQELVDEWLILRDQRQDRGPSGKTGQAQQKKLASEKRQASEVKRLERAIGKVQEEIANKKTGIWREVGDWLVAEQNLSVPMEYTAFVDGRRSLAWNIENCFTRGKELKRKLVATEERLRHLQQELIQAQSKAVSMFERPEPVKAQNSRNKLGKAGVARFRTVVLPGGLSARLGRSAEDNINLLKAARAWDIWLHLRGHPGSHAIVTRDKQKIVNDEVLRLVGVALVEQTFANKTEQRRGERFELIVAECRFVKPQRGDKKGRVTYTHDRTVTFKFT